MYPCRLCGQHQLSPLLEFGQHPIAHHLLSDLSDEEYVHHVSVNFCGCCGLIQLVDPIPPDLLYSDYGSLSGWKLNPHIPRILELIERLPGITTASRIVEIGCNDGSFLEVLRNRGYQRVVGLEPASNAQQATRDKGIDCVGGYFDVENAQRLHSSYGNCDLLIARHVLEHTTDLATFQSAMRALLSPGSHVLIEVPHMDFHMRTNDYTAIWEEHVNYFSLGNLEVFLADAGVKVISSETATFSGEALIVVGTYVGDSLRRPPNGYVEELRDHAFGFRDYWPSFRNGLTQHLKEHRNRGGHVALYGAGCGACSLTNFVGLAPYIDFVVDDQPEKQGKFMPGSHLPIFSSEALNGGSIDLCLLAVHAENEDKVMAKHRDYQTNGGRFASVLPPSNRLLPMWNRGMAAT